MHQNTESANVTDWFHDRIYRMPFISQKHEQNGECQITASNSSNDGLKITSPLSIGLRAVRLLRASYP